MDSRQRAPFLLLRLGTYKGAEKSAMHGGDAFGSNVELNRLTSSLEYTKRDAITVEITKINPEWLSSCCWMQIRQEGEKANMALASSCCCYCWCSCSFSPNYRTEHKHGELDYGQLAACSRARKKRGGQKTAVNTEASALHVRASGNRK